MKDFTQYKKIFLALLLPFLLFFFSSCLSENHIFEEPSVSYIPDSFNWQTVTDEVSYADVILPDFPLIYHIVKIDISSPDISVIDYYVNGNRTDRPEMINVLNKKINPLVLINTAPFKYSNKLALKFSWMPSTYKNIGIHISQKKLLSPPADRYSAVAFYKNEDNSTRAEIFVKQNEPGLLEADFAFGGFYTILKDFEIREFPANNYDSRSACGISEDGKTFYLLAVEGEQQKHSIGLSYPACAEIFLQLGCKDAMQFDGGGTTCLYVNGRNRLSYKPFRKSPAFMGFK